MGDLISTASLSEIAYEKNIPISATIELLTKCNLNCLHCYISEHSDNGLNYETLIELFHDLRRAGTLTLNFTGGEIFLRDDIFKIIEAARNLHFRVNLLSTATLLDEEGIKKLADLYIKEFSASIYSLDSSIHDSITGVKGSLEKTINNLMLMKKYNISVEVKTPLMKDNYMTYKVLQEFCKDNRFKHELTPVITSRNNGDTWPQSLRIDENYLPDILRETDIDIKEKKKKSFDEDAEPCKLIFSSLYIDCKGNVYPCNSFLYKVGNIFQNSVIYIWNNSQKLKYLKEIRNKDLHECVDCSLRDSCKRCPGLSLSEDNSLLGCSSTDKCMAAARSKIYKEMGI